MSPGARAIVSVRWGPLAARKALIAPGAALRVGRGAPSDLIVPHDAKLDPVHFELRWDGQSCALRDLGSAGGTSLDGLAVTQALAPHGAFIRAGDTVFTVHVEGATEGAHPPAMTALEERAVAALAAMTEESPISGARPRVLFALLDAARDDRILEILRESPEEQRSLYDGAQGDALAEVAPHLVALPRGSALAARLVREGWGRSWGVYLTSRRPLAEVRAHLRRLTTVTVGGSARRFYFRFYDPRVLRTFLPTCSVRQEADVFGDRDIEGFVVEAEDGEPLRFAPRGRVVG